MAKDLRKINASIRLSKGRGVFAAGKEDELQEALTPVEAKNLTEAGLIEGFHGNKTEKAPEKASEKAK